MSREGFMQMVRAKLRERSEGKLRRALGGPLAGESSEQLDHIGGQDRSRAEQGLVPIKEGGRISYKHIDDLSPLDMRFVTAAARVEVGWLKERVERRKRGAETPPIPTMKSLTRSYDYLAGLDLMRQDYLATLSELRSAGGLTEPERNHLRRELAVEHRVRCAQEWKAISVQLKADQDVKR